MSATGITDVGVVRSSNEDNLAVLLGRDAPLGDALLAVADGMGGHVAGEVASRMSLNLLIEALSNTSSPTEQSFRKAVDHANEGVYLASLDRDLRGMGTTLVAGLLVGDVLLICNVGDSRAYLLRDGTLRQVTKDHSWVGEMVDKGLLTPAQASVHPNRNMLTRALGTGASVQIDTTRIILQQGDRILICSDGLYGLVDDRTIAAVLERNSLNKAAREMVNLAKRAGGTDNITVIVARMDSATRTVQSESVADTSGITLPPR